MQRDTLKALYDVHSWLGLFLGLVLYVVLFSGSVSLFVDELRPWETGSLSSTERLDASALDAAVAHAGSAIAPGTGFSVEPNSRYHPWITVHSGDGHGPQTASYYHPRQGTEVSIPQESIALLLERLHTDLLLPSPWGRYLTGLLGVAMLVSLGTGVFMHRKIFREMWRLRLWRSTRLKWADLHKAVAVWGLPFHLMIAFTGTYLGLVGFTLLLNAFVAFGGDVESATTALGGISLEASGEAALMLPTSTLVQSVQTALPGFTPEYLAYNHYGDRNATILVLGALPETLIYRPGALVSAASGKLIEVINWRSDHWARALYGAMTPLHYASYGGLLLKVLYAVLGLGASFLVVSGLRIWQLRVQPHAGDWRLPLIAGVCYGLPLAMAIILCTSRLLTAATFSSYQGRLSLFLTAWVMAVLFAFWRRQRNPGTALCRWTALLLALLPVATALGGRTSPEALLRAGVTSPALMVEMTLCLMGITGLVVIRAKGSPR